MCSEGVIPQARSVKYMQLRVESPFPLQSSYGEKCLTCRKSGIASTLSIPRPYLPLRIWLLPNRCIRPCYWLPEPQPTVTVPESHFCCVFEQNSSLVVLSCNYVSRFTLEEGALTKLSDKREKTPHTVWPNGPPRFLSPMVYFVQNNSWC